jgi:hypothetical protein
MNDRTLLAILAAIIWSEQRDELKAEAEDDDGPDDGSIREAVSYAADILVEVDEHLENSKPAGSRIVDAEIVDEPQPIRRNRR